MVNFGYSYYSIKNAYPSDLLGLLEENGVNGYQINATNIPISVLFGSEVTAPVILEKDGELLKLSPTITPTSFPILQLEYYIEISGLEMLKLGFENLEENLEEAINSLFDQDEEAIVEPETSLADCGNTYDARISFECFHALIDETVNLANKPNAKSMALVFDIDKKIFWQSVYNVENNMIFIDVSGEETGYLTHQTIEFLDYYNFTKGGGTSDITYGIVMHKDELQRKNTAIAIYEIIKTYNVPSTSTSTFEWIYF